MPKHRNLLTFTATALASVVALAFVAAGCSDAAPADTCFDYTTFTGTTPAVTFKADVLPIFRLSCGLSTACHQSQSGPAGQPYLGPAKLDPDPTQADIDKIFAQNVDVTATKAPTMKIVNPGSPQTSFLMHKVDGTLECSDVKCDAAGCGQLMPLGSTSPMAETDRDTIRRWIAQGAKND